MKMRKWMFGGIVALLLCGCAIDNSGNSNNNNNDSDNENEAVGTFVYNNNGEISFTDKEYESDKSGLISDKKVTIAFNGMEEPTITGECADITIKKDAVRGDGKTYLIINSSAKNAEYEVSGSCDDGALLIFSEKKFKLTLNNLSLKSNNWPAINIQSGKRCFVVLQGENSLAGAGVMQPGENLLNPEYVEGVSAQKDKYLDCKATLFSEGELIFSGNGELKVIGNAQHAICSDDYVRVLNGKLTVLGAKSDGIHANDSVFINGGTIDITSKANGIQCEKGFIYVNDGTTNITSGKTGIRADYKDFSEDSSLIEQPFVLIEKGTVKIETAELKGHGIESGSHLLITGGKVTIATKGNSAKGLKSGTNKDSTVKGDIVIAKTAKVNITVSGSSNAAVAVKSEAGIYLRGGLLEAVADGSGGMGLSASENVVISGGDNKVYAAGYFLNTTEATINTGANLLAVGSMCGVTSFKDCTQKYMIGKIDSEIAAGKQYEVDGVTDEFVTNLTPLTMLFTKNGLSDKVSIKIDGTDWSKDFELK